MDFNSLYPNHCHDDVKEAVMELVMESQRELFVYDVRELCKYMAIILNEEEINEKGLVCYLPRRYNESTRKARPGMAYLETSTTKTKDGIKEKWVWDDWTEPEGNILKLLVSHMMRISRFGLN